ncbi:MAG: hypothetical protein ACTSRA_18895 [Promethearchaeota archaeon]
MNPEKDDLTTRSVLRYTTTLSNELDKINIDPSLKINYESIRELLDLLNRFIDAYNIHGRKWVPKFRKEFKDQLKALQTFTQKLFNDKGKLDKFLIKQYAKVKDVEKLSESIVRLANICDKVSADRKKLASLKQQIKGNKEKLEMLENKLVALEKNDLISKERLLFRKENSIKQGIKLELSKVKKSIKKLQKAVEDRVLKLRYGINEKELKDYFRNIFNSLLKDGAEYPKMRAILQNLADGLENGTIQLRSDKKEKLQSNITDLKDNLSLKTRIEEYFKVQQERNKVKEDIKNAGFDEKIQELKQKIAELTESKLHAENELHRSKQHVINTLNKINELKQEIEKSINECFNEDVSIILEL